MNDEQLESLLRQAAESESPLSGPSPQLSGKVLSTVARRQTRRRRVLVAASVAGAYLAGLLTMWVSFPRDEISEPVPPQRIASHDDPRPMSETTQVQSTPVAEVPEHPSVEEPPGTEALVETGSGEQSVYQLFRELGDASHARGDVTSSVRYYRLALDSATTQELQPADGADSLLLLSLKQDRIAALELTKQEEAL